MANVDDRLVYWQYEVIKALAELKQARSFEVADLIELPPKYTLQVITALHGKGLIESERLPGTYKGFATITI